MEKLIDTKLVSFYITQECNLSCAHCFRTNRGYFSGEELSAGEFCGVIDELTDIDIIRLLGGEPLLELEKVIKITRYAVSLNKKVVVLTNTLLLDEEKLGLLKEAGVYTIQVSCEGIGRVQDRIRGRGYFESLLWKVKKIREYGINCTMVITLTPENIFQIGDMYTIAQNLGIRKVVFSITLPVNGRYGLYLSFEQFDEGIEKLANILKNQKEERFSEIEFSPLVVNYLFACKNPWLWENYYGVLQMAFQRLKKCVEKGKFCLFPNGDVYPCPFFPYLNHPLPPVGNVKRQSVSLIRRRINDIYNQINVDDPECKKCEFFELCHGGCRAKAYMHTGSLNGVDRECPIRNQERVKKEVKYA